MNKIFRIILLILILAFLFLYLSYRNGYYIKRNSDNNILTEEKIREYENDLKNGVDTSKKDYVVVRENYDTEYSRFILKLSNGIQKGFDSTIKFIFQRISKIINE